MLLTSLKIMINYSFMDQVDAVNPEISLNFSNTNKVTHEAELFLDIQTSAQRKCKVCFPSSFKKII